MKKITVIFLALVLAAPVLTGCTRTGYQAGGLGALVGGVAGALINGGNPYQGAVLGGALGALFGGAMGEMQEQRLAQGYITTQRAAYTTGRAQYYQQGPYAIQAQPYADRGGRVIVTNRFYKNGRLVRENQEVYQR